MNKAEKKKLDGADFIGIGLLGLLGGGRVGRFLGLTMLGVFVVFGGFGLIYAVVRALIETSGQ